MKPELYLIQTRYHKKKFFENINGIKIKYLFIGLKVDNLSLILHIYDASIIIIDSN